MSKKKYLRFMVKFLAIVTCFCIVIIAAGCNQENNTSSSTSSGASESSVVEVKEIKIWGEWSGEAETQVNTMVSKFNEEQDEIEVEYLVIADMVTKFLTASATGQTPDLIIWDRFMTSLYAPKGVMHPIDEYITRDAVDTGDFFPEAIRELSYNEETFGLPITVDGWNLFINKKLFEEKNLQIPTTWDELAYCAKELTIWEGDKLVRSGLSLAWAPWLFNQWIQTAGGQVVSDDGTKTTFNSEEGLKVLEFWNKLLNEDKVYTIGFEAGLGDAGDPFVTGKIAITWGGMWSVDGYKKYGDELEFELIPMPAGPDGDRGGFIGGFGLIIPKAAKNKDQSWEFMKWWAADSENALEWAKVSKSVPGNMTVTDDEFFTGDTNYKNLVEAMKHAKMRPPFEGYSSLESQVIGPHLQRYLEGKVSAEKVLEDMQKQGDNLLKSYQN